jgi:hypothetical protein
MCCLLRWERVAEAHARLKGVRGVPDLDAYRCVHAECCRQSHARAVMCCWAFWLACGPQVFPKQLLLMSLPPEVDILCTHPMFGPDSGKGSWAGLNFMFEKVRIGTDPKRERRVDLFLKVRPCGRPDTQQADSKRTARLALTYSAVDMCPAVTAFA